MTRHYQTIQEFRDNLAPNSLAKIVAGARKGEILDPDYPYPRRMRRKQYEAEMAPLQIQLVRMQRSLIETGQRLAIIFEGRDAAGKGGTIKVMSANLNHRFARIVALAKPSERERSQWYFQRYIRHLPSAGEAVFFDRSWYNRGVIEPVFGFCKEEERDLFFGQVPHFEEMITNDGIIFIKLWLTISRPEQLRRLLARETDPLKQWKISPIDIAGLTKWEEYSRAIDLMLDKTHSPHAPWIVIRADDKKRARLEVIRHVLSNIDYAGKDPRLLEPDIKLYMEPG